MAKSNKVLVLGLDGMEPDTTRRMVDAGRMPNVKKLLERGAARQDLELLGAMPTITPAQWTTLATRYYRLLELAEDGSLVRMWMSTAFKIDCDDRWSPKSIYKIWNYACQKPGCAPEAEYQKQIDLTYEVADEYIGTFLPLLDEGWTIIITSDHGKMIHDKALARLGSAGGVSAGIMKELGYTAFVKDAEGNDTTEIDWANTKAVAIRTSYIWINLKGRNPQGIVDPADKYDLEEPFFVAL